MIHTGDCVTVMATMEPDSVDAVVTDPPYGLEFMGKGWDKFGATIEPTTDTSWDDRPPGSSTPFGGGGQRVRYHKAPGAFQAWCEAWGREALRVTKPGGYLLAFGGTRTHHRLVCGLEDAGWIIRDELQWNYLQGFPKGRANLKPAHEPIVLARKPGPLRHLNIEDNRIPVTGPTTIIDAWELDANLCASCAVDADSQERRGAGATRASITPRRAEVWLSEPGGSAATGGSPGTSASRGSERTGRSSTSSSTARSGRTPTAPSRRDTSSTTSTERRPTTVLRTCPSCGATSTDTTTTETGSSTPSDPLKPNISDGATSAGRWPSNVLVLSEDAAIYDQANPYVVGSGAGDEGIGVSRVFYVPKADRADREPVLRGQLEPVAGSRMQDGMKTGSGNDRNVVRENSHATVKPTDLMRHLIRLVTPPGGTILDPFLGSGSTAIAAELEGFPWIGIEKEPEYVAIAEARLNGTQRGLGLDVPAPTRRDIGKQRGNKDEDGRPTLTSRQNPHDNGYSGGWKGTGLYRAEQMGTAWSRDSGRYRHVEHDPTCVQNCPNLGTDEGPPCPDEHRCRGCDAEHVA